MTGSRRRSAVESTLVALLCAAVVSGCAGLPTDPTVPGGPASSPEPGASVATPPSAAPSSPASAQPSTRPSTVPSALPGTALAALRTLRVRGRAPMTGYRRSQFGGRWPDVDGNGCDTRDDVLARDLVDVTYRPGGCLVATGVLHDPYTGATIDFRRGVTTSALVQIDHVVALGDAWQKGAQGWSLQRRTQFANDPLELLAVGAEVNQAKGDSDAASWLPPRRAYRCAYVARQVAVKAKYGLWVTAAERDAMARVLSTCPAQPLPRG